MTVPLRNSPRTGSAHAQPTPLLSFYVQVPAEQVRDLDPPPMGEGPIAPHVYMPSGVLATVDGAVGRPGQDGVVGGQDVVGFADSASPRGAEAHSSSVAGLLISGVGAALLTWADAGTSYAAWVLPGLILVGAGIGSAIVSAVAAGQQGVDPRDAGGTAGAVNNVAQQLGAALGVAVISTFVATATSHYLTDHGSTALVGATVHGSTIGFWWAAGLFWAGAVICGALIRGGTMLHQEAGQPEPLDEISGLF